MKIFHIVATILLIVLAAIAVIRYRKLTLPRSYNTIDSLHFLLEDVKAKLPPGSTLGFQTDMSSREVELYFKTALVMAPTIIEPGESDTILILNNRQSPDACVTNLRCILSGKNESYSYHLVCGN